MCLTFQSLNKYILPRSFSVNGMLLNDLFTPPCVSAAFPVMCTFCFGGLFIAAGRRHAEGTMRGWY